MFWNQCPLLFSSRKISHTCMYGFDSQWIFIHNENVFFCECVLYVIAVVIKNKQTTKPCLISLVYSINTVKIRDKEILCLIFHIPSLISSWPVFFLLFYCLYILRAVKGRCRPYLCIIYQLQGDGIGLVL